MKKSQIFIAPLSWGLFFISLQICCSVIGFASGQSVKTSSENIFRITKVIMANKINDDGTVEKPTDSFNTESAHFYVSIHFPNPKSDINLVVRWENADTKTLILKNTYTISKDKNSAIFYLSRPFNGWPEGNYRVSFLIEKKLLRQHEFKVFK